MGKTGRKTGKPKTGGRKRGTPNKVTANIRQLASAHGEDMIKELSRLAVKSESEQVRVAAIREMLDRGYGKSVATHEISGKDGVSLIGNFDTPDKEIVRQYLTLRFEVNDMDEERLREAMKPFEKMLEQQAQRRNR